MNYSTAHSHLLRHFPKAGKCQECGRPAKTQHALIHGREHSKDRADYLELCSGCHHVYDDIASYHQGEKNNHAKLTADRVRAIRHRAASGETHRSLAREYGVSPRNVGLIVSGRTWGHLS